MEVIGTYMLVTVLAEFDQRHPKVCVELIIEARLYSLPRREADMVFRVRAGSLTAIRVSELLA